MKSPSFPAPALLAATLLTAALLTAMIADPEPSSAEHARPSDPAPFAAPAAAPHDEELTLPPLRFPELPGAPANRPGDRAVLPRRIGTPPADWRGRLSVVLTPSRNLPGRVMVLDNNTLRLGSHFGLSNGQAWNWGPYPDSFLDARTLSFPMP